MDPLIRYLLKYPVYYVPSLWMYLELLEFHYSMTPSLDTLVQILAKASLIPGYPCTTLFQRIHIEKKVPCPPYIALAWLRYACRSDPSSVSTLLHLFYSHRWWLDENDAWYVFRLFKSTHRPSQDIAMLLHLLPSNALTSHFKQVCLKKFIQDQHLPFTQALAPHVDMTPTLARLIALKFPPITAMALLFPNDETEGWIHLNSELVQWTAFHAPALTLLLLQSLPFPLSDEQYGYYIKVLAELNLSDHLEHLVNYLPTPIPYPIQLALIKAYCKLNQPNQALLLLSSLPHPPPPHDPSVWISYYRCLVRQPNHSISPPPSSGSTMTYAPTSLSSTSTSASISTSISTSTSTSTSTSPFLNSMTMVPSDLFQKNVHVTSYFHLIMKSMIHHHQECQVSKVLPYVPTWTSSTLTLVVLAIHQHIMRPKHDQDPLWLDQMVQWIQLVVQQGFFQSHHWMKLIPSLAHGHRWQDLSVLLSHIPSLPLDTRGQCMKSGVFKIHLHESTKQSLTSLVLTRLNECQQQQQQQNKPFNGEMAIQLNLEIQEIQKLKKVIDSLP
ncbi:hypothetical protein HMI54_006928 [Coelomomyces lativittatus]|nr:hypothetical protein HMI54_006928 [Coelomomyces lativittatus]